MNNLYKRLVTLSMISVTALLAWVYCIIEYRDKVAYIVGISLVVIGSIFALLTAYADLRVTKDAKLKNYVNETILHALDKMSAEDYSDELAEFGKLNKATYVQIRKINSHLSEIINDDTKSLQQDIDSFESLSASIDKIAKVVVKYGQANNEQLISAINDLSDNLDRINSNIELVRSEMLNMENSVPVQITREHNDSIEPKFVGERESETEADVIPFPAKEEEVDPNRPMTPEEIEALFAAAVANKDQADEKADTEGVEGGEVTGAEVSEEEEAVETTEGAPIIQMGDMAETISTEQQDFSQASNNVVAEPMDDPNRPMTPEEIAALFASMQ